VQLARAVLIISGQFLRASPDTRREKAPPANSAPDAFKNCLLSMSFDSIPSLPATLEGMQRIAIDMDEVVADTIAISSKDTTKSSAKLSRRRTFTANTFSK